MGDTLVPTHTTAIQQRIDAVLNQLKRAGRATMLSVATAIGIHPMQARYAMVILRNEQKAHISEFTRSVGADGIARHVAVFAAGKGRDAQAPLGVRSTANSLLDMSGGQHLQEIYVAWAQTRTPDYVIEDEDSEVPKVQQCGELCVVDEEADRAQERVLQRAPLHLDRGGDIDRASSGEGPKGAEGEEDAGDASSSAPTHRVQQPLSERNRVGPAAWVFPRSGIESAAAWLVGRASAHHPNVKVQL